MIELLKIIICEYSENAKNRKSSAQVKDILSLEFTFYDSDPLCYSSYFINKSVTYIRRAQWNSYYAIKLLQ